MRPLVYLIRAFALLIVPAGLWAAWQLSTADEPLRGGLIATASVAFAFAVWLSPYSRVMRFALAIGFVAAALATGSVFALVAVGVFVLLVVALRRLNLVRVDPASVRAVAANAVMRGAERFVADFTELGWTQVGAVGFDVLRRTVVVSVLLNPDRTRYGSVTDVVMTVTSQVDDIRLVVTRNSAVADLPPALLANDQVGASAAELVSAHDRALGVIARFGVEPVPQVVELLVGKVIDHERAALEAAAGRRVSPTESVFGRGPIDGSAESLQRVRSWLGLPPGDS